MSNIATWDSSNPWSMADYILASGMPLDDDERRAVQRAHEGGHTWSVTRLHGLNVLCFEARGWLRADRERALAVKAGLPTTLRGACDLGITNTLRLVYIAAACAGVIRDQTIEIFRARPGGAPWTAQKVSGASHVSWGLADAVLETLAEGYGCPVAREMMGTT